MKKPLKSPHKELHKALSLANRVVRDGLDATYAIEELYNVVADMEETIKDLEREVAWLRRRIEKGGKK